MTPLQIARELDNDPELLDLHCMTLLQYAEAKSTIDSANKGMIESLRKNSPHVCGLVEANMFALKREEMDVEEDA